MEVINVKPVIQIVLNVLYSTLIAQNVIKIML